MQHLTNLKPRSITEIKALQEADIMTKRSLQAQKTAHLCLKHAHEEIIKVLGDNPEVEPEDIATRLAQQLHTFLMIGPADAHEKAPEAFAAAIESKGINTTDLDIAAMAYGANHGRSFIITRKPDEARQYRKELEAQGKVAKSWNKGAYVIVYVQA